MGAVGVHEIPHDVVAIDAVDSCRIRSGTSRIIIAPAKSLLANTAVTKTTRTGMHRIFMLFSFLWRCVPEILPHDYIHLSPIPKNIAYNGR